MTQTSDANSETLALSPAARLLWAVLILATLYLCYFHNLGALGLVGPDEPRYAWIARDMAETGDWVTPLLYGKPWFEKPPLYYWGAALSFKLFGVSETTARLPSAFCALLATLALAWLARRVYGGETARWLLLLLPTTVGMIGFSHAAATDMPFAGMLAIAMVFAAQLLGLIPQTAPAQPNSPRPRLSITSLTSSTSFTSVLFGFFLGLATLAKGPAAIILSGGAVLLWAAFTRRWRDAFRCLHPIAIASFCLTALPWYVLCARRNPDFFGVFIIEHNFKRFLTPEFQHIQPFWFYGPILLVAVLPWTILFLSGFYLFCRVALRKNHPCPEDLFFLCCAIFPLLFFSVSRSKLPGYILPSVPMLGMLMARMTSSTRPEMRRIALYSYYASAVAAAIGAFIHSFLPKLLPSRLQDFHYALALVLGGFAWTFGFVGLSLLIKRSTAARVLLTGIGFCVFLVILAIGGSRQIINRSGIWMYSARDLSHSLLAAGQNPANLRLIGVNRSTRYQLNFYLRTDLRDWDGEVKPGEVLLGHSITCKGLKLNASCKDLWGTMDSADDWELLQITAPISLNGLGGTLGDGRDFGGLRDRQAR